MIDFQSELKKYKPLLEVDNIEASVNNGSEIKDIIDLLKHVALTNEPQNSKTREE